MVRSERQNVMAWRGLTEARQKLKQLRLQARGVHCPVHKAKNK